MDAHIEERLSRAGDFPGQGSLRVSLTHLPGPGGGGLPLPPSLPPPLGSETTALRHRGPGSRRGGGGPVDLAQAGGRGSQAAGRQEDRTGEERAPARCPGARCA